RKPRLRARASLRVRRARPREDRGRPRPRGRARPRAGADPRRRRAGGAAHLHRDAGAARDRRRPRPRPRGLGEAGVRISVGPLYPDYLNIYADRGNIAVLTARAAARGHDLDVTPIGLGDAVPAGVHLFYVGGGQDREQELIAPDLAAKGPALHEAVASGSAF